MKRIYTLILILFVLVSSDSFSQRKKKKREKEEPQTEKQEDKKDKKKSYSEIITEDAETEEGLFTYHKVKDKHYFEVADTLLGREILVVSRIAGIIDGFSFGGAGMKAGAQKVIRWEKKDDKILLRYVSYSSVASEELPIYESVRNNNFEPIIKSFDIETMSDDSTSMVIEVSDLFTSDIKMLSPINTYNKKQFGVGGLDKSRTFIDEVKSFPLNTEVKHILTYSATKLPSNSSTQTLSLKMNQSFILLDKEPWQPRYYDKRVNYFSVSQNDYGMDEQKAASKRYITRWRLEPKDVEAYKSGELVEPIKPIVYYVDPATPEKWRKYIKQGVEDWQKAFEAAGFKNAILAKDPPSKEEDPDWSPEDVRNSVIRYISTTIQNAQGPHVHDPRSGEIIESDILWYHNVMNLLRNWYFVQTAAINPEARSVKFKDEVMGELIRFVSAHEVGHTLGLPHNMGASWSYPVDSLRSPTFTKEMGTAPSIMDYARFNYVAQPEDEGVALQPGIGVYDLHAIKYGYRYIPEANSAEEEKETLHKWIREHEDDNMYRFGFRDGIDPTSQTEDLGDNSMKASEYGVANLKRIVPNLIEWTDEIAKDYDDLDELYGNVVSQFRRYIGHVTTNVGGIYTFNRTYDQEGDVHIHVEKEKQKDAVRWLNEYVFDTPEWLLDQEILSKITKTGVLDNINGIQSRAMSSLLSASRMERMIENEALNGSSAYTISELFDDVRRNVWKELRSGTTISPYRRGLQRAHIDELEDLLNTDSDAAALARAELDRLDGMAAAAIGRTRDSMSKYHLRDIRARIDNILDPD